MNVFVLCTPRSGSYSFAKACSHISNYTSAHELNSRLLGKQRVIYKENHIEVDNRLVWFLGYLDEIYGDNAFYVHLIRDREKIAISNNKRWNLPASIVRAYGTAVLVRGECQREHDLEVSQDYFDTVSKNIQFFLKDKSKKMVFSVENAEEDFKEFWQKIGAEGNLDLALASWKVPRNASPKNEDSILKEWTKTPLVKINNIDVFGLNSKALLGCNIDLPQNSDRQYTYFIRILGWVLAKNSEVVAVEILNGGRIIQKVPVELPRPGVAKRFLEVPAAKNSGFRATVGLLGLPIVSELTLQAVLEDGNRVPFGRIKLRRLQAFRSIYTAKLRPLIVSSVGTSGGDKLLEILAGHPSLITMLESPGNVQPSQYWLQLLPGLSPEENFADSFIKNISASEKRNERSELSYWWERTYPEKLTDLCLQSIDSFYSQAKAIPEKNGYFVENYDASHPECLNLLSELYPEGKEIILVRDFRDVVCSMLPFSGHKSEGLKPKKIKSYQHFVCEFGKDSVNSLLERWKERKSHAYLVKYEDLILSAEETVKGILQYLGVDSSPETVAMMLQKVEGQTTSQPEAVIGDWQYEMPVSLQVLCSEVCAAALQEFGYL